MIVSIIIPCYNVEDYIEDCINSVISQTYKLIEIICVDDGSNDGTLSKLKCFANQNKIILIQQKNSGAPSARNLGLKYAKGEWIQFLDADDLLCENKIEHQVKLIKNKADVIYAVSYKINLSNYKIINNTSSIIELGLLSTKLGNTCANLFNKSKLLEVNGWSEEYESSQEYELMFKLYKSNAIFVQDNIPLTIIRERSEGQISTTNISKKWDTYIKLRIEMIDFIIKNHSIFYLKYEKEILKILFDSLISFSFFNLEGSSYLFNKYLQNKNPEKNMLKKFLFFFKYRVIGFKFIVRLKKIIGK